MPDTSGNLVLLIRLGLATRGLVYLMLGYLALTTASAARVDDGAGDIFAVLSAIPGGTLVLYLVAAGLGGYALFRLCAALFDIERKGSSTKGVAYRIAYLASAAIHAAMAWTAARMASGAREAGKDQSPEMAATVLDYPLGETVLGLAGIALVAAALFQTHNAVTAGFMRQIATDAPPATCWIGRAGHAARAVVMALIGWSLLRSAWSGRTDGVVSLGGAINDLRQAETVFVLVAGGLVLFGVFSLITARFRILPDPLPDSARRRAERILRI